MTWQAEAFDPTCHDRTQFNSGVASLDRYLKERLNPHARQGVSRTYVAIPQTAQSDPRPVQGFYTLSAGAIEFEELPDSLKQWLPRYPVPIALIGKLAVEQTVQGQDPYHVTKLPRMNAALCALGKEMVIGFKDVAVSAKFTFV